MTGQTFWRKNLTLVVGVTLPLLLVLLFWVAMLVPRMTVEPPQYDLVLASRYYYPEGRQLNGTLDFTLEEGRLYARFSEDPDYPRPVNNMPAIAIPVPKLYYFASATGNLREIDFDLPEDLADGAMIAITELADRTLVAESTAPDGYRFDNSYRGSRGFLFFFDGYRYNAKIEKNGRAEKIPSINQNDYFASYELVGWAHRVSP